MKLTWKMQPDAAYGYCYALQGFPSPAHCATIHYAPAHRQFIGRAFIGGQYLSHRAGTLRAAMSRMNAEIDKRSIGLLGVDVIEFVEPEQAT